MARCRRRVLLPLAPLTLLSTAVEAREGGRVDCARDGERNVTADCAAAESEDEATAAAPEAEDRAVKGPPQSPPAAP